MREINKYWDFNSAYCEVTRSEWILNREVVEDTAGGTEIKQMCDKI